MSQVTEEKEELVATPVTTVKPEKGGIFARQRLSVLEKTALVTSAIRFLAALSALLAFVTAKATPSSDIPIVAAVSLAIVVLLATGFRWAPVVSIPLAAYVLYDTFTQPFVLFDLANPKGPNGGQGFALFIAAVLALATTIIVLGCCIGASVQNYRQGSRRAPRWYIPGMALVAGLIIGALFIGAMAEPPTTTGTAFTNGVPTVHMGAGGFVQPEVTIAKGSKLLLVDDSSVEHVLFNGSWQNGTPQLTQEPGAPVVSNVHLKGNSVTIGPFTTAGTYHIFCSLHQGMNLTIIVQ